MICNGPFDGQKGCRDDGEIDSFQKEEKRSLDDMEDAESQTKFPFQNASALSHGTTEACYGRNRCQFGQTSCKRERQNKSRSVR
jgi:hypothetical protein